MKAERLFQILGLVDESLIEEADTAPPPPPPLYSGGPHGFGFWPRPHVSR